MECKVIDLVKYKDIRDIKMEEISLGMLKNTHISTLVIVISNEIITLNKQLATLKYNKNKIIQNEYNYFSRAKEALINVIEKIEKYFATSQVVQVTFNELDCVFGTVESNLQNMVWIGKTDNEEYKNICRVYKKLKPVYDANKIIWEKINPGVKGL